MDADAEPPGMGLRRVIERLTGSLTGLQKNHQSIKNKKAPQKRGF
jgi:hypothetical protein